MNRMRIITLHTFLWLSVFCLNAQVTNDKIHLLETLQLPNAVIETVEYVPVGDYTPPGTQFVIRNLPSFIRVAILSQPTPESKIRIEVWLPDKEWNGRFAGTGNGGSAGYISYQALAGGITHGFATANTDMGTSPHVDQIIDYPQRWEDFGHRATHEMTVTAKGVIKRYYDKMPDYSYFVGSSTGGQQALMTTQRYPDDYDGIIAVAPANNRTHLHAGFVWNYYLLNENLGYHFSKQQIQSIHDAIIDINVGKDGGYPGDRFLTDPRMATFNPEVLDTCLSRQQIDVLKKLYSGPINRKTGENFYTPIPLGSEASPEGIAALQQDHFQRYFYPFRWIWGLDFDFRQFDFDKDLDRLDQELALILNANNPDLETFKRNGGKILMYTGTSDPLVPLQDAINYYERVVSEQGSLEETQSFFRYFLVPGMWHGNSGVGPHSFGQNISSLSSDSNYNAFAALVKWVEEGIAPDSIIATLYRKEGEVQMRRPIFPYPKFPHYSEGDPNLPSSYRAVEHKRGLVVQPAPKYLR